jgi:hypothetical protein
VRSGRERNDKRGDEHSQCHLFLLASGLLILGFLLAPTMTRHRTAQKVSNAAVTA